MSIWVLAEHLNGLLQPVTLEVLAFARRVAEAVEEDLVPVVIGRQVRPLAEQIARVSGEAVLAVECPAASTYEAELYRGLLQRLADRVSPPRFLFVPHTATGWDFAPALAVDRRASSLSAVSGFRAEGGDPVFHRRILNGKLLREVRPLPGRPAVVTVMPGSEKPLQGEAEPPGSVTVFELSPSPSRIEVLALREPPPSSVDLREAEVIVAAGRGIGDPEHLDLLRELAALFRRGALGASRPLCDQGILPLECQVGMTGQSVSPKLYIACGISGAIQHTMGIKNADLVISINTDPAAPFTREAHYSVIADLHTFLPLLTRKIRELQGGGAEGP